MSQSAVDQALKGQRILLTSIGNAEPVEDDVIAARALLLTRSAPSPASASEIELAFHFWGRPSGASAPEIEKTAPEIKVLGIATKTGIQPMVGDQQIARERQRIAKVRRQFAERWWEGVAPQRAWFREAVCSIIDDPDAARRRLRADIEAGVDLVVVLPRLTWDGRSSRTDLFYLCPTIESAMGLALMKLLAVNDALRACKLGSCGRLFLSYPPASGGPRPSYCVPEHRERATQLSGAERTQRWRRKQAKA